MWPEYHAISTIPCARCTLFLRWYEHHISFILSPLLTSLLFPLLIYTQHILRCCTAPKSIIFMHTGTMTTTFTYKYYDVETHKHEGIYHFCLWSFQLNFLLSDLSFWFFNNYVLILCRCVPKELLADSACWSVWLSWSDCISTCIPPRVIEQ